MKPNPLSSLNHFTVPVAILALLGWRAAHSEDALRQRHGALALHSPDPDGPAVPGEQYCLTRGSGCRPDKAAPPDQRASEAYSGFGSMFVAIAIRLARQYRQPLAWLTTTAMSSRPAASRLSLGTCRMRKCANQALRRSGRNTQTRKTFGTKPSRSRAFANRPRKPSGRSASSGTGIHE